MKLHEHEQHSDLQVIFYSKIKEHCILERFGKVSFATSKISTKFKGLLEFSPPPKNILFVDDVDASQRRG
jgi:hypothetical protein